MLTGPREAKHVNSELMVPGPRQDYRVGGYNAIAQIKTQVRKAGMWRRCVWRLGIIARDMGPLSENNYVGQGVGVCFISAPLVWKGIIYGVYCRCVR